MFKKKKLYKIVYQSYATYTTIIAAKDEFQAIEKFHKITKEARVSIISFEEYKLEQ